MAALLGTSVGNISKHLNNKFGSGELSKEENTVDLKSGTNSFEFPKMPSLTKQPILYNFEAIIAVAFSVNSKRAIMVRRWAKEILENVQFMMVILQH